MSAGQLNLNTTAMATPEEMTEGVLAVLGGSSLDLVAADLGIQAADLVDAIQTYQRAGRTALETQAADRIGLSATTQSILANVAKTVVLGQ